MRRGIMYRELRSLVWPLTENEKSIVSFGNCDVEC